MHGPGEFLRENRFVLRSALAARDLAPALHEGSAEALPWPGASVHLVVTSPPYPMIEMWDADLAKQTGLASTDPAFFDAAHALLARAWAECRRVLVPGGLLAVNVGDATRKLPGGDFRCWPNHAEVTRRCEALGFQSLVPILWKKPTNKPNAFLGSGFLPPNAYVTLDCEFILLFRNGSARTLPPKDPLRYASEFSKAERDTWFSQIWDFKGARQDDGLAAFPEEVPERLVRMFSCLGETVLDPFAGSGTTLRVARRLGRRALAAERNADLWPALRAEAAKGASDAESVFDALEARYPVVAPRAAR